MTFFIGEWEVLPDLNRLRRGGDVVEVEPRVMAVLEELARVPGRVVTREDLHRTVWGDVIVTDDALTRCVRELRRLLGDDARTPTFIETISKRGYRLIAPVVRGSGSEPEPPTSRGAEVVVNASGLLGHRAEVTGGTDERERIVLRRENVHLTATRRDSGFEVRTRILAAATPLFTAFGACLLTFMLLYGRTFQAGHVVAWSLIAGIAGGFAGLPARRRALDRSRSAIEAFARSLGGQDRYPPSRRADPGDEHDRSG